jgi:hypothetical protein
MIELPCKTVVGVARDAKRLEAILVEAVLPGVPAGAIEGSAPWEIIVIARHKERARPGLGTELLTLILCQPRTFPCRQFDVPVDVRNTPKDLCEASGFLKPTTTVCASLLGANRQHRIPYSRRRKLTTEVPKVRRYARQSPGPYRRRCSCPPAPQWVLVLKPPLAV